MTRLRLALGYRCHRVRKVCIVRVRGDGLAMPGEMSLLHFTKSVLILMCLSYWLSFSAPSVVLIFARKYQLVLVIGSGKVLALPH